MAQLRRPPANWRPALTSPVSSVPCQVDDETFNAQIEFAWAGDTARHVGTLVDRHLERIAREGIDNWPPERVDGVEQILRRGLQNLGVASSALKPPSQGERALRQTLADEHGAGRSPSTRRGRAYWPLTAHEETSRHYVIDCSSLDEDGVRWIIDQQDGEHLEGDRDAFLDQEQEGYREQIENYAEIIRLLEDRPIRLELDFLLFPDRRVGLRNERRGPMKISSISERLPTHRRTDRGLAGVPRLGPSGSGLPDPFLARGVTSIGGIRASATGIS